MTNGRLPILMQSEWRGFLAISSISRLVFNFLIAQINRIRLSGDFEWCECVRRTLFICIFIEYVHMFMNMFTDMFTERIEGSRVYLSYTPSKEFAHMLSKAVVDLVSSTKGEAFISRLKMEIFEHDHSNEHKQTRLQFALRTPAASTGSPQTSLGIIEPDQIFRFWEYVRCSMEAFAGQCVSEACGLVELVTAYRLRLILEMFLGMILGIVLEMILSLILLLIFLLIFLLILWRIFCNFSSNLLEYKQLFEQQFLWYLLIISRWISRWRHDETMETMIRLELRSNCGLRGWTWRRVQESGRAAKALRRAPRTQVIIRLSLSFSKALKIKSNGRLLFSRRRARSVDDAQDPGISDDSQA